MEDYESKYEKYKNKLLHEKLFRNKLVDLYRGSLNVEEDYIRENGALWKVGVLSFACGLCFSLFSISGNSAGIIITRIILFIIMVAIFIFAMKIGKNFAKKFGERKFYAYEYDKYFIDRIQEDKQKEMYRFERDLSDTIVFMQRCSTKQSYESSMVLEEFKQALHYMEELEKQYKDTSRYDYFARSLKNDYWFNAEIQEDIEKYI